MATPTTPVALTLTPTRSATAVSSAPRRSCSAASPPTPPPGSAWLVVLGLVRLGLLLGLLLGLPLLLLLLAFPLLLQATNQLMLRTRQHSEACDERLLL